MGLFHDLRRAKELGLNLTTVLVKAYLEECGHQPVGKIADACAISIRSVERAIAQLKTLNFFYNQKTTTMSHDHDKTFTRRERTTTGLADVSAGDGGKPAAQQTKQDGTSDRHREDPLAMKLVELEVLPWCVDILLAKVDRAVIERQVEYHAHRLAKGFAFKSHPAKFLFRACLNDYMPPTDYFAARQKPAAPAASRPSSPLPAAPVPVEAPTPAPEAPAPMSRSGALTVIRMGVRSKLPTMRDQAVRLSVEWEVDLREFGADPQLVAEADALRAQAM